MTSSSEYPYLIRSLGRTYTSASSANNSVEITTSKRFARQCCLRRAEYPWGVIKAETQTLVSTAMTMGGMFFADLLTEGSDVGFDFFGVQVLRAGVNLRQHGV